MNMTRLTLFLLLAALVTGAAGWYLSNRYIEDSVVSHKQKFDQGQEKVKIVVATTDLAVGISINSSNAVLRDMPQAYVHRDAIKMQDFAMIDGRQLLYPLAAGDPILTAHVSLSEYRSFSDMIPPGMQAITIPIDSPNSISGFLAPGDSIDLLITLRDGNTSKTTRLLAATTVIATGTNIDNGLNPKNQYNEITLGVTSLDATRVTHAMNIGKVTVILRSPEETNISKKHTITAKNLIDRKKQARPVKTKRFEVIRGGK